MDTRRKIPFKDATLMLIGYAKVRIVEQIKSVAFIILYLIGFQTLILGVPLADALTLSIGIAMVVFGLAFFLEGLVLGLMPLGERVGVKLPTRVGIFIIALFGILLGFGATFAEPAISALKTAGSSVTSWDSPLLYLILEKYTNQLIMIIGTGVGVAVALGMFRFYYNLSIKPFILILVPLILGLSIVFSFDSNLSKIIGLAWDSGAVTTGAVTVPLVLALGIGVSRASSKGKDTGGGFGIILLASLFPILSVLLLGLVINSKVPKATSEIEFFAPEYRDKALNLFDSEEKLLTHAFTHGTEEGRKSFFGDEQAYTQAILSMKEHPEEAAKYIGNQPLSNWIINKASEHERNLLSDINLAKNTGNSGTSIPNVLKDESIGGIRAVIPLSLLLVIVLILFLKDKLKYKDEIALGIIFTLVGMTLLTAGIRLGLAALGGEVGGELPRAFAQKEKFIDRVVINDFDKDIVFKAISPAGDQKQFFNLVEEDNVTRIEFIPSRFDDANNRYEHIITQKPLFKSNLSTLGIILVLLFAFGMGFGATLAEPALNALGLTVENLTVGTIKRGQIVHVVSIGVGVGLLLGFSRILFDIPLIWLLTPSYVLVLILTIFSDKDFSAIAWDSGGVTTGPVTVPLVLAMGLGIGGTLHISDGFGILALASVFPIITVLTYGFYAQAKQRKSIQNDLNKDSDE